MCVYREYVFGHFGCSYSRFSSLNVEPAICASRHVVSYHKVSRNIKVLDTHSHLSTLHKHTAKNSMQTEWESTSWPSIYGAAHDPYLFLWVLQAASHRHATHRHTEGLWTLTLCAATAKRGKNHTTVHSLTCTFLSLHVIFSAVESN